MSKKAWIILLGLVVILGVGWHFVLQRHSGGGFAAGGRGGPGGHRGRGGVDPNQPVPVVAGTVERKDVPIYLDGLGTVQAFNAVNVKARVDGQLEKVAFTEGQDVKVATCSRRSTCVPTRPCSTRPWRRRPRTPRWLPTRNWSSSGTRISSTRRCSTSRLSTPSGSRSISWWQPCKADQAAIDNAQTQVDYTHITAPLAGRVGVRQVDQGNLVHATDTGGLVVITQLQPISVVFTLPEQNFQSIRDNYPADPAKDPMTVLAVGRDNCRSDSPRARWR